MTVISRVKRLLLWGPSLFWVGKFLLGSAALMTRLGGEWMRGISVRLLVWILVLRCGGFHVICLREQEKTVDMSPFTRIARAMIEMAVLSASVCLDSVLAGLCRQDLYLPVLLLLAFFDVVYCGIVYAMTKDYLSLIWVAMRSLKASKGR